MGELTNIEFYIAALLTIIVIGLIPYIYICAWKRPKELKNLNQQLENKVEERAKQLEKSENLFRGIFENSMNAVFLIDNQGLFMQVNTSFLEVIGAEPGNIIGKSPYYWINDKKNKTILKEGLRLLLAGKLESVTDEVNINKFDGTSIWVQVKAIAQKNENNEIDYILGTFYDITKSKETEIKIRKFSLAVEQSPVSIVITNLKGDIEYVNPAFSKITGYKSSEVLGRNPRILKSNKTPEKTYKELWEQLIRGEVWEGEFINKKKNGTTYYEAVVMAPIKDKKGTISHYLALKSNITDLKKYTNQLQELNATKDKFFSIIAHDLKNPFGGLRGLSSLLVENLEEYSTEKLRIFLEQIHSVAQNGYKLLENLLEWARSQTGRIEYKPERIELRKAVWDTLETQNNLLNQKEIEINLEIESPFVVFADSNMLATIIRNLISNAIKFSFPKGEIKILAKKTNDIATITVTDQGMGISKETQEKLFRIDEKMSTLGTNNEKGTGLGLLLCKEFIEKHNGRIWVESQAGKGSSFSFTLPVILFTPSSGNKEKS